MSAREALQYFLKNFNTQARKIGEEVWDEPVLPAQARH